MNIPWCPYACWVPVFIFWEHMGYWSFLAEECTSWGRGAAIGPQVVDLRAWIERVCCHAASDGRPEGLNQESVLPCSLRWESWESWGPEVGEIDPGSAEIWLKRLSIQELGRDHWYSMSFGSWKEATSCPWTFCATPGTTSKQSAVTG